MIEVEGELHLIFTSRDLHPHLVTGHKSNKFVHWSTLWLQTLRVDLGPLTDQLHLKLQKTVPVAREKLFNSFPGHLTDTRTTNTEN